MRSTRPALSWTALSRSMTSSAPAENFVFGSVKKRFRFRYGRPLSSLRARPSGRIQFRGGALGEARLRIRRQTVRRLNERVAGYEPQAAALSAYFLMSLPAATPGRAVRND